MTNSAAKVWMFLSPAYANILWQILISLLKMYMVRALLCMLNDDPRKTVIT